MESTKTKKTVNEEFLHFLWKYNYFEPNNFQTINNEPIEVLSTGTHNHDAGPDFFNAKIKIGDTLWAGNVEIHTNASDWFKHHHENDKAYQNIILHVVYNNDVEPEKFSQSANPLAIINFDERILQKYETLLESKTWIACENEIGEFDKFRMDYWLNHLLIERLENKAQIIQLKLTANNNNWEETFYHQLARNFGFSVNGEPFELMAKSLPISYIAKHKNSIFQIEALLFGQAGMLDDDCQDIYFQNLKKEHEFLRNKFSLQPIEKHLWKFLRLRPSNFPTIRLAQFAQLIYKSTALFSKLIETADINDIYRHFEVSTSEYWINHYVFGKESEEREKFLGNDAIETIIINTVVPFLFVYGKARGNEAFCDRALEFLEKLNVEKNTIITNWKKCGVAASNAFYSQALIQLKNEYCTKKRCLHCQVGSKILTLSGLADTDRF